MGRLGFVLIAAAIAASPALSAGRACTPTGVATDASLSAGVDALVDAAVESGFAGEVVIIRDGAIVYTRAAGFSDAEKTVPVTAGTLFHVASITKYLTATLVLKAAESGKLRLDDPLALHLPGMKLAARGTILADLLAHRSGLGSSYAAEAHADAEGAVAAIDTAGVDESKVGAFRYSNDGYDLLAIILERVYGEPYEEIARRMLKSACIERAGFWGEVDLADPARVGQPLERPSEELRKRNYGMIGSAGFLVTAEDLARLELALSKGEILNADSLAALRAPRGALSFGEATFGAFLLNGESGPVLSARGYEDWGDNAIVNHYLQKGVIVSVVTSKGPPEGTPPFRDVLSKSIAELLLADDS